MRKTRRWLLAGLALLFNIALIAVGAAWWAVGTESGTRWLVGQALETIEADVEIQGPSGTLWQGLRLEHVAYTDAEREVDLRGLELEIDWSSTTLAHVAIARLELQQLSVASIGEPATASGPVDLDIPPPPVSISVATIDIAAAEVDELSASGIEVRDVGFDGLRVQVASAGATVDVYDLRLDGIEAELRDDLPIRTGFSWAAVDTGFSGDGSIEGSLRGLELEHELYGQYPMRSSGTVDLTEPGDPSFDVVSTFEEWRYEEWVARDATVRLFGTVQDYQSELALAVSCLLYTSDAADEGVEGWSRGVAG